MSPIARFRFSVLASMAMLGLAALIVSQLAGCNTVRGLGQDISNAADFVEHGAAQESTP